MLNNFLKRICDDPRIGPSHISLYMAIVYCFREQNYRRPVSVFGRDLRRLAKIGGSGLYHRCIRDLKECGYIHYEPKIVISYFF